jgi:hypothetical protein
MLTRAKSTNVPVIDNTKRILFRQQTEPTIIIDKEEEIDTTPEDVEIVIDPTTKSTNEFPDTTIYISNCTFDDDQVKVELILLFDTPNKYVPDHAQLYKDTDELYSFILKQGKKKFLKENNKFITACDFIVPKSANVVNVHMGNSRYLFIDFGKNKLHVNFDIEFLDTMAVIATK